MTMVRGGFRSVISERGKGTSQDGNFDLGRITRSMERIRSSADLELRQSCAAERQIRRGKLDVVEEGALADLLLVQGDPIANIKLIDDPATNFVVIMKGGKIHKPSLSQ